MELDKKGIYLQIQQKSPAGLTCASDSITSEASITSTCSSSSDYVGTLCIC